MPTARCLRDILNDEHYTKYGSYSDINVTTPAILHTSAMPVTSDQITTPLPPPEPPPLHHVEEVHLQDWMEAESKQIGDSYYSPDLPTTNATTDDSIVDWDTLMFPLSDLHLHTYSPATILTLLARHDSTRFTRAVTPELLRQQHFRLQVDGGANRSVTNNRDYLHTSWDITPYQIGGIGSGIQCTAKGIFTLSARTAPSSPSRCSTLRMPQRRLYLLPTLYSPTRISLIAGGRYLIAKLAVENYGFIKPTV